MTSPQYPYGQSPQPGSVPPAPQYSGGYGGYQQPKTNTLAIVSLICAIGGLIVGIAAPIGAILGHVALKQIRERGEQGEGMAKAGIIVGWILTALMVLAVCGVIGIAILAASAEAA